MHYLYCSQMQLSKPQGACGAGTIRSYAASRKHCVRVRADARTKGLTDPAVKLVNGAVTEGTFTAPNLHNSVMHCLAVIT